MHPPRIAFVGALYHITVRCNNREFYFQEEKDFETYLDILFRTKKIYKIKVHAYCITSNHVHLMLSTPEENTLSSFMQYLNGNYSKAYNKLHNKTGRFWGGRFYSTIIESETQFFNTLTYIELNMARAKAVEDPKDWKWSSYHAHAFGKEDRVLDFHPLYNEIGRDSLERQQNYRNMVYGQMEEKGLLHDPSLTRGIVMGSESFVTSILHLFQGKYSFYSHRKLIACKQDSFCINRPHRNLPLLS
mgnify:FL=1